MLDANAAAIDSLLQRDFNEPAGGAVDYRCAHPSIVVIFAAIDRLASGERRDELRGYVSENEVSVWCLTADLSAGGRLVWYLPYVFVDCGQASASGREVYGYPKQMGAFEAGYPEALENGGTTTVEALAIDPYDPDAKAVLRPMISADRLAERPSDEAVVGTGADAFAALLDRFTSRLEVRANLPFGPAPRPSAAITPVGFEPPRRSARPLPPVWSGRRVLDTLLGRDLIAPQGMIAEMVENPTLVFLKQFRDVSCPTKACYQAIVEAPLAVHLTSATYEALDASLFEITIDDWDSHPIASDLGVQPRVALSPDLAFRATFDFDIQLGFEVWRAPT